jgi:rhodanese-related sulfurtransferase
VNENGRNQQILDVRPTNLYNIVHLLNSQNIPFEILNKMTKEEIEEKLRLNETNEVIPVSCVRGMTSKHAVKYLNSIGLKAYSLKGGILAYRKKFDQNIPEL